MRGKERWTRRLIALSLAFLLAACGGGDEAPAEEKAPLRPRGAFDRNALDLDRPCTLLTADDAADVSGQPYYRTMAANSVERNHIRCAQGVGDFGLHGMVELDVIMPEEGEAADVVFSRLCRVHVAQPAQAAPAPTPPPASQGEEEAADPAPAPAAPPQPAPPEIPGEHCLQSNGGVAFLLPDRVIIARARLGAGEIDPEGSRRLAVLIGGRLSEN